MASHTFAALQAVATPAHHAASPPPGTFFLFSLFFIRKEKSVRYKHRRCDHQEKEKDSIPL
jgi:hypothetical protein